MLFLVTRPDGPGLDTSKVVFVDTPIEVGDAPQSVAVGEGGVWVVNAGDGTISFIDAESAEVEGEPIAVGPIPSGIAAGGGSVWIGFGEGATTIARIDSERREIIDEDIEIGRSPSQLTFGGDKLWVAAVVGDVVARVDAGTGVVEKRAAPEVLDFPSHIAVGLGSVWVTDVRKDQLVQIDPQTLEIEDRIATGFAPTAVAIAGDALWVANFDKTVTRVDPSAEDATETITLSATASALVAAEGYVWATLPKADAIARIDASSGTVGALIPVGDEPQGIAFGSGDLWVANQGDDTVSRVDLHPDPEAEE